MTTKERDEFIAAQLNAGVSLSDVQTKLAQEYGVKMTYFELRMLAMGLSVDWEKQDKPKPAAAPAPVVAAAQQATAEAGDAAEDAGDLEDLPEAAEEEDDAVDDDDMAEDEEAVGGTKITLDETPHPGAALSGTAVFASGASGKWALSRNGRLGFEPDEGSKEPDENDWQLFQAELQKTLQGVEEEENTTVVDVDKVVRPGVQLSGSVTFASGAKGRWYIGPRGLGVEPDEGSAKPSQKDVILFQRKLQEVLQKQGY